MPPSLAGELPAAACLRAYFEARAVLLARVDEHGRLELLPLGSSNRPLQLGETLFVMRDPHEHSEEGDGVMRRADSGSPYVATVRSSQPASGSTSPRMSPRTSPRTSPRLRQRSPSLSSAFAAAAARFRLPVRLRGQKRPSWEGNSLMSRAAKAGGGSRASPEGAGGLLTAFSARPAPPGGYQPLPAPPRSPMMSATAPLATAPLPPPPLPNMPSSSASGGSSACGGSSSARGGSSSTRGGGSARGSSSTRERMSPDLFEGETPWQLGALQKAPNQQQRRQQKCNPLSRRLDLASALSRPPKLPLSAAAASARSRGVAGGSSPPLLGLGGKSGGSSPPRLILPGGRSKSSPINRRLSKEKSVPAAPAAGTFTVSAAMLHSLVEAAGAAGAAAAGSASATKVAATGAEAGAATGAAIAGDDWVELVGESPPMALPSDPELLSSPPLPPAHISGHVILCGLPSHCSALRDFVASLRSRAHYEKMESCPDVVLLQPQPPSAEQWREARTLRRVFYVSGSRSEMRDLLRAGISSASFLVMPRSDQAQGGSASQRGLGRSEENHHHALYEDAATILACREIESLGELEVGLAVEIAHASNVDFLLPHVADDEAARASSYGQHTSAQLSPYFAAGRVLVPSTFDAMLCASMRMSELPELLDEMLLGGAGNGCLLQWTIPPELECRSYGELVEKLLREYSALAVGLFRGGRDVSSPLPYVFTNPPRTTELYLDDLVYVIGRPVDAMRCDG